MKKIVLLVAVLLMALAGVLVGRAMGLESRQGAPEAFVDITIGETGAAERLAGALRYRTISFPPPVGTAIGKLARTVRQTIPEEVLVAPYLVMGGTDAKYYSPRSPNVFRFLAAKIGAGDMVRVHGTDERLRPESFANSIRFFVRLTRNVESLP